MSLEFRVQSSEFRVWAALLISAFIVQHSSFALAGVKSMWFAEASRPVSEAITVYQGETVRLEPSMRSYGAAITNITGATLFWQSPDMGMSWWSKPAEVQDGQISAVFHPTNDVGATAYNFFIRANSDGGASYRANGTLKMRPSPGYMPSTLPPPLLFPLAVDLVPYVAALMPACDPLGSALAVSNALVDANGPLATKAELHSTSNALATAIALPGKAFSLIDNGEFSSVYIDQGRVMLKNNGLFNYYKLEQRPDWAGHLVKNSAGLALLYLGRSISLSTKPATQLIMWFRLSTGLGP